MENLTREQLIEKIVTAARRSCPTIVGITYVLCSDGEHRSIHGIPSNVKVIRPLSWKLVGYAYQDKHGTTYGKMGKTEQELIDLFNANQATNDATFRADLEQLTPEQLMSQAVYWLRIS